MSLYLHRDVIRTTMHNLYDHISFIQRYSSLSLVIGKLMDAEVVDANHACATACYLRINERHKH